MTIALNGNLKYIIAVAIPLLAAAVGYGVLKERVNENERRIYETEQRANVRLQRIEDKVDKLLERGR